MTWPIDRGRLAAASPRAPRQEEHRARSAKTPEGVQLYQELVAKRRRRDRGDAARLARARGLGYRGPARAQSEDRVLQHLGLRHDGSVPAICPRTASRSTPGAACDQARDRRQTASAYIPEHASIGMHAGPMFGALGILAAVIRARATGEGCELEIGQSDADRVHGLVSHRELAGVRAPRRRRHGQQVRRLRAPRAGHRGHEGRRALPDLRVLATGTCCSWRPSRRSGRTSA